MKTKNIKLIKFLVIFFLLIVPFSISDYSDNVEPEKITSDLRFYEINTCSISLNEFLIKNPNVIYQDHYKIRFNNYSSARCFGQITGIDQLGYTFYISIGTNSLVNLLLQSSVWILLISLIKSKKQFNYDLKSFISQIFAATMVCILIYSEKRYYSKMLFELDLEVLRSYVYLFSYFFYVSFFSYYVLKTREEKVIYFAPFMYILMGLYSGFNFYFFMLFFVIVGIEITIKYKKIRNYFNLFNLLILFWGYSAVSQNFYLKPDKIRGLSSSSYNFLTVSIWSYIIIFTIIGILFYTYERINDINLKHFRNNFLITGFLILILGYLGSSMPYVNFMNYYYFGQTKLGTDNQNIFSVNYWGESEAWRGFFPSAETIGEFFAISLILFFISSKFNLKNDKFYFFLIPFSLVGLYASNNKAALITLLLCLFLKFNNNFELNNIIKISGFVFVFSIFIYFIRIENLLFDLEFTSRKMIDMGFNYGIENSRSSFINYYYSDESNLLVRFLILVFGQLAFLINRSELWGLFFSRFNPNRTELLLGTGPFNLVDHYSDIDISTIRISTGTPLGFLLPHSSFLLFLIFFGVLGLIVLIFIFVTNIKKMRSYNYDLFLIALFISINIFKSDSILYLPSLATYIMFLFSFNIKRKIKNSNLSI